MNNYRVLNIATNKQPHPFASLAPCLKMECKKCNLVFVNSSSLKKHNDLFCNMECNLVDRKNQNFPLSLNQVRQLYSCASLSTGIFLVQTCCCVVIYNFFQIFFKLFSSCFTFTFSFITRGFYLSQGIDVMSYSNFPINLVIVF